MSSIFSGERDARRREHIAQVRNAAPAGRPVTRKGTRLRHRLVRSQSIASEKAARWGCATTSIILAAGSGVATWFLDVRLEPDDAWVLIVTTLAAVVFGIAGLGFLVAALRFTFASRTPETVIELDEIELRPGGRTALYVKQEGPLEITRLELLLRGTELVRVSTEWEYLDEEDRLRRGGDTQQWEVPVERPILEVAGIAIDGRSPFEKTLSLDVPDYALPTGSSQMRERLLAEDLGSNVPSNAQKVRRFHNTTVRWDIVVSGEVARRADFRHEFPILVRLADASGEPGFHD